MTAALHNALVTGGTQGIGRAVARRLALEGHRVTVVFRSNIAARDAFAEEAARAGWEMGFEQVDLTQPDGVSDLFLRLSRAEREPDILVNAAGMAKDAPIAFLGAAQFNEVIAANLTSAFLTCQQAVKAMVRRRVGRIVNFSSPAALLGNEGQVAYAAAKAGILGLTRSLAREVAPFGITVNAVSPGLTRTEMTAKLPEARLQELLRRVPLRRMAEPEEVAGLVWMLCHPDAAFMTGQCLSIDGGLS